MYISMEIKQALNQAIADQASKENPKDVALMFYGDYIQDMVFAYCSFA